MLFIFPSSPASSKPAHLTTDRHLLHVKKLKQLTEREQELEEENDSQLYFL